MLSIEERIDLLRRYFPSASDEDWEVQVAGLRRHRHAPQYLDDKCIVGAKLPEQPLAHHLTIAMDPEDR